MQHITNNQVFLLLILLSYADSPFFPVTACYINQHSKKLAQCQLFLFDSINTFLVFEILLGINPEHCMQFQCYLYIHLEVFSI